MTDIEALAKALNCSFLWEAKGCKAALTAAGWTLTRTEELEELLATLMPVEPIHHEELGDFAVYHCYACGYAVGSDELGTPADWRRTHGPGCDLAEALEQTLEPKGAER